MIAIKLEGRLGNQLFQYAFIYAAGKKLDVNFYLDQRLEKSLVHKYFMIDVTFADAINIILSNLTNNRRIFNFLRKKTNRGLANAYKLKTKAYEFNCSEATIEYVDNTLYIGYFQSVLFMHLYEDLISKKLTLKKRFSEAFSNKYRQLYETKTVVTIHVRRTDYKNLGHLNLGNNDLTLPLSYYQNALAAITHKNLHYFFISDDTDFIENNFPDIEPKTISKETEIYDFQHLLNAEICIISNSTFSWWGAWLNAQKNKIVYCPRYYLGYHLKKQIPLNIYPKEWRLIDFT